MSAQGIDNRLVDRLADLFPYAEDVVNLARRAGLDTDQIRLTGAVQNQMGEVVRFARAHGHVGSLIAAALQLAPGDAELEQLNQESARPVPPRRRTGGAGHMSPEVIGREEADVLRDMAERLRQVELRAELTVQQLSYMTKSLDTLALAVSHRPNGLVPLWILTGVNTATLVVIVSIIVQLVRSLP
jgi:hypothetical protein